MIKSMTGYGSAKGTVDGLEISVELKSVNNKFLDASVRMPRSFLFAESAVKSLVQQHISRGKVDVFVTVDSSMADDMTVRVNDAISAGICAVAEQALCDFDAMRLREGEKLRDDVLSRLATIDSLVSRVEHEAPATVLEYRRRLEQKMTEVLGAAGIDENRIIAEVAIFADRIAVDEETVRLRSHMAQLSTMINGSNATGRKIDFLIQEFNREANTIGSKCQNADIAHVVVNLKSEIEKIREQIQNIE